MMHFRIGTMPAVYLLSLKMCVQEISVQFIISFFKRARCVVITGILAVYIAGTLAWYGPPYWIDAALKILNKINDKGLFITRKFIIVHGATAQKIFYKNSRIVLSLIGKENRRWNFTCLNSRNNNFDRSFSCQFMV